jgi:hypothetical protein
VARTRGPLGRIALYGQISLSNIPGSLSRSLRAALVESISATHRAWIKKVTERLLRLDAVKHWSLTVLRYCQLHPSIQADTFRLRPMLDNALPLV